MFKIINIPRFYARLTLPPSKRPHPGLLYIMYLNASRISTQPALRALEPRFYELAKVKIEKGLREGDRLLDIVRALTLMAGYLFSKEWYNLGYNVAGQTIRWVEGKTVRLTTDSRRPAGCIGSRRACGSRNAKVIRLST